ncbi:MAG: sulfotransferase domain-containing protein [bacterium]|nr:sulfotransferase domain-containing protein [bacterium]
MDSSIKNKNIVWLASYPKSGNTWFRIFLSNLLSEKNEEENINSLYSTPIASSRSMFEELLCIESSDLTNGEIDLMRPEFYRNISSEVPDSEQSYHKIHDAFTKNKNAEWIFPPEITHGAVYFLRNPLDVSVSFANHNTCSLDKSIKNMNDSEFAFCDNKNSLPSQLRQILLTWSGHVLSWMNAPVPVCIIRYEDMKLDSFNTFKKAVKFMELDKSDEKIRSAIEKSSFDNLQKQENEKGFKEKSQKAESFFRKGEVGDWHNHLNESQVVNIINKHSKVMELFGYIKNGLPVF